MSLPLTDSTGPSTERPSLTPITHSDLDRPTISPRGLLLALLSAVITLLGLTRYLIRPFVVELVGRNAGKPVPLWRIVRGMGLQSLWIAPGLVAASGACLWLLVFPAKPIGEVEGTRLPGVFAERVSIESEGLWLSALWLPGADARDVLSQGDEVVRPRPAVVLVHDHGYDGRQMLPTARHLHERGWHVLVLDLRGSGQSDDAPATMGRREWRDVEAGIAYLASRSTVDSQRLAAWGLGSGAAAAARAQGPIVVIAEGEMPDGLDVEAIGDGWYASAGRATARWLTQMWLGDAPPALRTDGRVVQVRAGDSEAALAALESRLGHRIGLKPQAAGR